MKVYNDLLQAADRGEVSLLCLLDLSAAFDTVDHELLVKRLECKFGIVGQPLEWIKSYLTGRSFSVKYQSEMSSTVKLVCSVPQGSVLGPLLFILYTSELPEVATCYNIYVHSYADDTQLFLHCKLHDTDAAVTNMEKCIAYMKVWMASNRLKLNPCLLYTSPSPRD